MHHKLFFACVSGCVSALAAVNVAPAVGETEEEGTTTASVNPPAVVVSESRIVPNEILPLPDDVAPGVPRGGDCSSGEVHDDNDPETGYGWNGGVTDGILVDRFTPTSYPYAYNTVCVCWIGQGISPDIDFSIVMYDDDGPGGAPGTQLMSILASAIGVPSNLPGVFSSNDVSMVTPAIQNGSVYIGVRWNPSVYATFFVCADESGTTPLNGGYRFNNVDNMWQPTQNHFPNYRAMLIRATGAETVDCNGNMIPDEREVAPDISSGLGTDCEHAANLIVPGMAIGITSTSLAFDPQQCGAQFSVYGVWARYRPAWSGTAFIGLISQSTPFMMTVFDNCPVAGGMQIACNTPNPNGVTFPVVRGRTYFIRGAAIGVATGSFNIRVVGPRNLLSSHDYNVNGIPDDCECIFDVNNDGIVDFFDFLDARQHQGMCTSIPCTGDVDGDGSVDDEDYMLILQNIGPCPLHPLAPPAGSAHAPEN